MATEHPFQQLFETFGKLPEAHAENVNRKAREAISERISVGLEKGGHCILLKAPRAGHGKTHLLTRLQHDLGGTHEFVPLHALGGSRIDATTVLDDILRRLVRPLPAAGGLTVLDLAARRLFSSSLQPLVRSGEVPCQDREGALNALRTRPIETFDFHHPSAVTAHWARENFELLGPRLSIELSQKSGLSLREVSFWVSAMFRFAATPIDNPGRVRALAASVFDDPAAESNAHERLVALLGLMTSLMRVVLVADELEGFSSDEAAALRFASFVGSLRQSVDRLEVIISINDDVWNSAFLPRLSAGLADRLSEVVVELKPLSREEKIAILDSRSPGMGVNILNKLDGGSIPSYARGLVQKAAEKFEEKDVVEEPSKDAPAEAVPGPVEPKIEIDRLSSLATVEAGPDLEEPAKPQAFSEDPLSQPVSPEIPVKQASESETLQDFNSPVGTGSEEPPAADNPFSTSPDPISDEEEPKISSDSAPSLSWPAPEMAPSKVGELPEVESPSGPVLKTSTEFEPRTPDSGFEAVAPEIPADVPQVEPHEQKGALNDPSSGFEAVPPPQEPAPQEPEKPAEVEQEAKTDRVDDLLRQFRERYGKS